MGWPLKSCTHTGIFPSVSGPSAIRRKSRKVPIMSTAGGGRAGGRAVGRAGGRGRGKYWGYCNATIYHACVPACVPMCVCVFGCMQVFDAMAYVFFYIISYFPYFVTLWRSFWHNDIVFDVMTYFLCCDILFDAMQNLWTSLRTSDVIILFDTITYLKYFLTLSHTFWRHECNT